MVNRRTCLKWAGGWATAAAGAMLPGTRAEAAANSPATASATRKRLLRVAHVTDIHVQPELRAAHGLAACLGHIQGQPDRPELILNTGDCVMDVMRTGRGRADVQWNTWSAVWKGECSLPAAHVLGNHDIWGWNVKKSGTMGDEPGWGKGQALDVLGMPRPYHSFNRGGWHFIGLDSVQKTEAAFMTRLDEEQFAWLEADLAATDPAMPTLVMSHMPIFAVAPLFNAKADPGTTPEPWRVDKADMHTDFRRIKDLFKKHPNVKQCISGHIHLVDHVQYLGVTYGCGGAVSGAWWSGSRFNECEPGYSLIDLYDDGSADRQYVAFGWDASKEIEKARAEHPDTAGTTK